MAGARGSIEDGGCCCSTEMELRTPPELLGIKGGGTMPWLTGNPVREGATVTDDTDDRPEDTTVTGGVVVGAMVEM